ERRVTADDTVWDDPARHHSSAVAALQGEDGRPGSETRATATAQRAQEVCRTAFARIASRM
ncbi:hypothetical protein, partial [Streptomyces olivaceus]